jgi:hypothetical protein
VKDSENGNEDRLHNPYSAPNYCYDVHMKGNQMTPVRVNCTLLFTLKQVTYQPLSIL